MTSCRGGSRRGDVMRCTSLQPWLAALRCVSGWGPCDGAVFLPVQVRWLWKQVPGPRRVMAPLVTPVCSTGGRLAL